MKLFFFLLIVIITSCTRDCACDCEKFRLERNIIALNRATVTIDTFSYYYYKKNEKDTISDSLYKLFLSERYTDDSFTILKTKDTFSSIKKVSGITCAGTNQYYRDSFFCTCVDK